MEMFRYKSGDSPGQGKSAQTSQAPPGVAVSTVIAGVAHPIAIDPGGDDRRCEESV